MIKDIHSTIFGLVLVFGTMLPSTEYVVTAYRLIARVLEIAVGGVIEMHQSDFPIQLRESAGQVVEDIVCCLNKCNFLQL